MAVLGWIALVGGLVAVAGAVLVLFIHELVRASRSPHESADPEGRSWAARRAGGESERLDRNW